MNRVSGNQVSRVSDITQVTLIFVSTSFPKHRKPPPRLIHPCKYQRQRYFAAISIAREDNSCRTFELLQKRIGSGAGEKISALLPRMSKLRRSVAAGEQRDETKHATFPPRRKIRYFAEFTIYKRIFVRRENSRHEFSKRATRYEPAARISATPDSV